MKVVGNNAANLGRADEINLFDANGTLVDRLTCGDQSFAGTVRAHNRSGTPLSLADLAPHAVTTGWVLATAGDAFGYTPRRWVTSATPAPSPPRRRSPSRRPTRCCWPASARS